MTLRRELGVFGATMTGLGSIVGTGVFVSIGIAAGIAGPAVIVAIALAFAVERQVWTIGLAVLAIGLTWHGYRVWCGYVQTPPMPPH